MKITERGVEIEVIFDSGDYPCEHTSQRYNLVLKTAHLTTIPLRAIGKDAGVPLEAIRRLAQAELAFNASLDSMIENHRW